MRNLLPAVVLLCLSFAAVAEDSSVESLETVATDVLSPAEKYDLLVGNHSKTMTRFSWNNSQNYYQSLGRVPTWMRICYGRSAATHMLAPITWAPVTLKAADGRRMIGTSQNQSLPDGRRRPRNHHGKVFHFTPSLKKIVEAAPQPALEAL